MTDSKESEVAVAYVKVHPNVKMVIEDEAVRLSRVEGKRVTQGQVVARAMISLRSTQKTGPVTGPSTGSKDATITELAERAAELAEGLRRIANEESGDAGGDPDRVIEELEQATEVEELKVKAARPARKSPAADREGVTK